MGLPSFSEVVVLVSQVVIAVLGGSTGPSQCSCMSSARTCAGAARSGSWSRGGSRGLPLALPHVIGLLWPRIPSAALAWCRWPPCS
jgi:hypothetical protein